MKRAIIIAALITLPTTSFAAKPRYYIGGSTGMAIFDSGVTNLTGTSALDEGGNPSKVFLGYIVNKKWSVEASYVVLGTIAEVSMNTGDTITYNGVTTTPAIVDGIKLTIDGSTTTLAAKYKYIIDKKSSVYGKLGVASYNLDAHLDSPLGAGSLDSSSGTDLIYGVGYQYAFTRKREWAVHVDYDGYNFEGGDNVMGMLSLGVSYSFK